MNDLHHEFIPRGKVGVLYLHGFMGNLEEMRPIVSSKASGLLIDLPGHGKSLHPHFFSWASFLSKLHLLLDRYPVQEWIFYGYSMGGRMILEYLKEWNPRPSFVILESASPGRGDDETRRAQDELLAARLEALREEEVFPFLHRWYEQKIFQGMNRHPDYLPYIRQKDVQNHPHWAKALRAFSVSGQKCCFETGPQGRGLYLCGQDDVAYARWGKEFADKWRYKLHTFPHSSHNVHFFHPKSIRHLIESLL
ncbi:MAG: alpha/beta fold hydrolase [Bacteriovoracales bacterium]|nr:alpha/beta fold hydrolase [Bacteriovoracales bacterium]